MPASWGAFASVALPSAGNWKITIAAGTALAAGMVVESSLTDPALLNPTLAARWETRVTTPFNTSGAFSGLTLSAPPVYSGTGAYQWVVGANPSGAWVGHTNDVATWDVLNAGWAFNTPVAGCIMIDLAHSNTWWFRWRGLALQPQRSADHHPDHDYRGADRLSPGVAVRGTDGRSRHPHHLLGGGIIMDTERTQRIRESIVAQHRAKHARKHEQLKHELRAVRFELIEAKNRWSDIGSEHREMGQFLINLANRLGRIQASLEIGDDTTVGVRILPPTQGPG